MKPQYHVIVVFLMMSLATVQPRRGVAKRDNKTDDVIDAADSKNEAATLKEPPVGSIAFASNNETEEGELIAPAMFNETISIRLSVAETDNVTIEEVMQLAKIEIDQRRSGANSDVAAMDASASDNAEKRLLEHNQQKGLTVQPLLDPDEGSDVENASSWSNAEDGAIKEVDSRTGLYLHNNVSYLQKSEVVYVNDSIEFVIKVNKTGMYVYELERAKDNNVSAQKMDDASLVIVEEIPNDWNETEHPLPPDTRFQHSPLEVVENVNGADDKFPLPSAKDPVSYMNDDDLPAALRDRGIVSSKYTTPLQSLLYYIQRFYCISYHFSHMPMTSFC